MHFPVFALSAALLGSIAFDSHADDLDSSSWLRLNENVFDSGQTLASMSARPNQTLSTLRQTLAAKKRQTPEEPRQLGNTKALPKEQVASDTNQRVIDRAKELIGTNYKWGGMSEASGFDCSGLLVYLFRSEAGVELPRTTTSMIHEDFQRVSRDELQPGDAVFFSQNGEGRVSHVGLYIGDNRFIHAPRTGQSIRIDSLDNQYWSSRYSSARRFENESSS